MFTSLFKLMLFSWVLAMLLVIESSSSETEVQIESLKRQIEEIETQHLKQIEELRKKIEELESKKGVEQKKIEELITEREEEEKDAWWRNFEAGYKNGFFLRTKDEKFSIRTRILSQFQLLVNGTDREDTATDFRVRRLQINWSGNAFKPWLLYAFEIEARSDVTLNDAFFDFAYDTRFAPRGGQYKVPFSREELNSTSTIHLIENSILNREFGWGRDRGAGIYGVIGNFITYGVGVFNGDGRNGTSTDSNLLYAGRLEFTLCCGKLIYRQGQFPVGGDYSMEPNFGPKGEPLLAIGIAGAAFPRLNIARKNPDNDITERFEEIFGNTVIEEGEAVANVYEFTVDMNFRYYMFSFEADYFLRNINLDDNGFRSVTDQGFRVQSGIFLIPRLIEIAGRFALIDFDKDASGRELEYEITPGLNIYLSRSHNWKLQFSYSFIREKDTDGEEINQNLFITQFQAYF